MADTKSTSDYSEKPAKSAVKLLSEKKAGAAQEPQVHIYHKGARCETDTIGFPTPNNRSPLELAVDASQGFIPLWAEGVTLRWRFQETSMLAFQNPEAAKAYIRILFGRGLLLWGDAVPVRFTEAADAWDFEIAVRAVPNCNANGCTLARAFFPDSGRHDLVLFPTLFDQPFAEQVETMAHELGHIFGLRHFFALLTEAAWPAEIFGDHSRFSIMNYGPDSRMTDADRDDLRALYSAVWSGMLTDINGTPIRTFLPFSTHVMPDPVPMMV